MFATRVALCRYRMYFFGVIIALIQLHKYWSTSDMIAHIKVKPVHQYKQTFSNTLWFISGVFIPAPGHHPASSIYWIRSSRCPGEGLKTWFRWQVIKITIILFIIKHLCMCYWGRTWVLSLSLRLHLLAEGFKLLLFKFSHNLVQGVNLSSLSLFELLLSRFLFASVTAGRCLLFLFVFSTSRLHFTNQIQTDQSLLIVDVGSINKRDCYP